VSTRVEQLIGRDRDLARLAATLERAPEGAGAVVILGEAGIGKTALWEATLSDAAERGYRICRARASQGEAQFSLAALGDLLDGVEHTVLAALPAPQRRALAVALLLEDASGPAAPRALAVAFLAALRELASAGPVVIAIDDAHWLDPTTLDLLSFASRRLETEPVLLLLAARDDVGGTTLELARCMPRVCEVGVGPVTLGAFAAIIRGRLDFSPSRPVLRKLHERSGGNPFFGLELARAVRERDAAGGTGAELSVPKTLQALVRERLDTLPGSVLDALLVAAVALEPPLSVLETAFEGPVDLAAAIDAGVVDLGAGNVRFTHPLLAASVLDEATPARRREIHARLVEIVEEPEQRVRHLAAAADGPDDSVAAALDDAAARASSRGAHPAAAELAELALSLTDPRDVACRARRAGIAGRLLSNVGDAVSGRRLMVLAIELLPPGNDRAAAIEMLLDSAAWTDDPVALGKEALEQADDDRLAGSLHVALAEVQLVRGAFDIALGHAREGERLARRVSDDRLLAVALARRGNLETVLGTGDPDAALTEAIELERSFPAGAPLGPIKTPRNHLARRQFWQDDFERARPSFEALREAAIDTGMDDSRPGVCLYLARLELRAGRPELSRTYVEEALELARSAGYPQVLGAALGVSALLAARAGETVSARDLLAESEALTLSVADRWHALHNRVTLGLLETSLGRHEQAWSALGTLAAEFDSVGIAEQGVYPFEGDALETAAALGLAVEAEGLIARLESHPRPRTLAIAERGRGLLLAARDDLDAAADRLEAALRHHGELEDPFECARTLLAQGTVLRRARRRREAKAALTGALDCFQQLGAAVFAERATRELARLGGRQASTGLTATEARVADLLAEGLSNKEIAATLVVSISAVEAHVSRIYAKLGLRSRAQLARTYAEQR
jgi:DNA-binding CsgD family transcriptional regulator